MTLANPNNCWPANMQKFADALANSAAFQTLVEADDATAANDFVFGKRLTHARSERRWTADEWADLRHYGMVFSDPESPFGYHLVNNAHYESHGLVIMAIGRLVPESQLVDPQDDRTGLNDEHDRDWQNIVGTVITEMLSWLQENGGPYPIPNVEIAEDYETRPKKAPATGIWQYTEVHFGYGITG